MKLIEDYLFKLQNDILNEVDIMALISKHGLQKAKEIIQKAKQRRKYVYPKQTELNKGA